jgi:hypothetical protein
VADAEFPKRATFREKRCEVLPEWVLSEHGIAVDDTRGDR